LLPWNSISSESQKPKLKIFLLIKKKELGIPFVHQLPLSYFIHLMVFRLVHAITPLEEGKSFLEKVQLGGKLCGLNDDTKFFPNLWGTDQKTGLSTLTSKYTYIPTEKLLKINSK